MNDLEAIPLILDEIGNVHGIGGQAVLSQQYDGYKGFQ